MKPWHRVVLAFVILTLIGGAVVIDGSDKVLARAIALNSVFTGLLTLTGFMFTARTFITFKLNETVYSKEEYQQRVEEFQRDGAYKHSLYEPLRRLDGTIGRACLFCFATLFLVLTFSFLPKEWSTLKPSLWETWTHWESATVRLPVAEAFPWRYVIYQIGTVAVFFVIFAIIIEALNAIRSVNNNIHDIINDWESRYSAKKAK